MAVGPRMADDHEVPGPRPSYSPSVSPGQRRGEILIPHATELQTVSAIKNLGLQSSLALLHLSGHYDRYERLVEPRVLEVLLSTLGPSWVPIDIADAHYAACDQLELSDDELAALGQQVGLRLQDTTLVSSSAATATPEVLAARLHRMWARLYQGGSVQVTALDPRTYELELLGFTLMRHRYYRSASLAVLSAVFSGAGLRVAKSRIMSFEPTGQRIVFRFWFR